MIESIIEALARNGERYPDRLCLADEEKEMTYREAWRYVTGFGEKLKALGIVKNDCVTVECTQDADYIICALAVRLVNAVFIPVEKNAGTVRIREIIDESASVLFIGRNPLDSSAEFLDIAEVLNYQSEETISPDNYTFPCKEDTAEILFSTGTTGKSKGVELSHDNVLATSENVVHGVEMKADNVEMVLAPTSHSHGLRRTYANIFNGSSVVFAKNPTLVKSVFNLIEKYRVTAIDMTPSICSIILKLSRSGLGKYAEQLDYIQMGAAPIPEDEKEYLIELLPHTRLYNFYGSTEAGCTCIYNFNTKDLKRNAIGKPAVNAKFIFVDEDRKKIAATPNEPGFLAVAGKQNMKGYWNEPELTASVTDGEYIYSKDLTYEDEDGDIRYIGRKDDVINYGGIKISPDEIEEQVNKCPLLTDCACTPVADKINGQAPKLHIVPTDENSFNMKEFRDFLSKVLDVNKLPKEIEIVDEIPRTYNGKIQRNKLMN